MDRQSAIMKLQGLRASYSPQIRLQAEDVLCELLRSVGEDSVADEFERLSKLERWPDFDE